MLKVGNAKMVFPGLHWDVALEPGLQYRESLERIVFGSLYDPPFLLLIVK
jgi:hypothetical protein